METTRARERTRSSACRFCIVVAGPILLVLLAAGCAMPQSPSSAAPPAALSASPAVPQPAGAGDRASTGACNAHAAARHEGPAWHRSPAHRRTTHPHVRTDGHPDARPAYREQASSPGGPEPVLSGRRHHVGGHFPKPASIKDGCILIGRSLTHNFELVSSWGSSIGEDLVQVTSDGLHVER